MAVNSRVKAVEAQWFNAANLTGGWDLVNPLGLPEACFYIRFVNVTNVDFEIGYDGVHAHDYIRSGQDININFQTNSQTSGYIANMQKGQHVYIWWMQSGVQPSGYFYLIGYYQE